MKSIPSKGRLALPTLALLGITLLLPGVARAQTTYQIQPIITLGDTIGDGQIKVALKDYFDLGNVNDSGQIIFIAANAAGGEMLVQYANDKFTLIVARGMDSPSGKWPSDVGIHAPVSINQTGNSVFSAVGTNGGLRPLGTFLWDRKAQKVTAVALKGMPAVNDLTFRDVVGKAPVINNRDEIAFSATVKTPGGRSGSGLFFLGRDGTLLPVLLSGPELPGGGTVHSDGYFLPSINDAGLVAFLARQQGDKQNSAYVWEPGTISPVLLVGSDAPGGKVTSVSSVHLNNRNRNVLVTARISGSSSYGLYLVANGQVNPVAVPGQEMPGGGKFVTIQGLPFSPEGNVFTEWVSAANDAGQHAFLATLEGGDTAAYLMEADGKLSLILKSGTSTTLGQITRVGSRGLSGSGGGATDSLGLGLNNKGQVLLTVKTTDHPVTLVLLTPAAPQE